MRDKVVVRDQIYEENQPKSSSVYKGIVIREREILGEIKVTQDKQIDESDSYSDDELVQNPEKQQRVIEIRKPRLAAAGVAAVVASIKPRNKKCGRQAKKALVDGP